MSWSDFFFSFSLNVLCFGKYYGESKSEVAQSCLTLCDPMDCSLPGSSVHGSFLGKSTGVACPCLLWRNHLTSTKIRNFLQNGSSS